MTTHSEQLNELAAALAEAQKQFPDLKRDRTVKVTSKKTGATYTFSYAPFERVIAAVRGPLHDNGLSFVQTVGCRADNGIPTLSTMLLHKSGQWIKDTAILVAYGEGNQDYGSAITYQKRYALTALLGIASDDDDDGNRADGNEAQSVGAPAPSDPDAPHKPSGVRGPYPAKYKFDCICGNTHAAQTPQLYWETGTNAVGKKTYGQAAVECFKHQWGEPA